MDQLKKKRERSVNFEKSEVRLLTELVTKYRAVIENKKTDAVTNKDKDVAWSKIASIFNAASSGAAPRTAKTLKLKYEGLKKETKKKMTIHRQELYRTGGGPSTAPDIDEINEQVLAICSNISGLESRNDSDNITDIVQPNLPAMLTTQPNNQPEHDIKDGLKNGDIIIEIHNEAEHIDDTDLNDSANMDILLENVFDDEDERKDTQSKWTSWNKKSLKTKVSSVLKPTKSSVTAKIDELSAARLELVRVQTKIAEEQHLFAKEEHNVKMFNLRREEERKEELHKMMMSAMQHRQIQ